LDSKGIDMIGCIHYDEDIFQSSLEGLSFGIGKSSGEILDVFDSLCFKEPNPKAISFSV